MSDFVGRTVELDRLTRLLAEISARAGAGRTHDLGTAVLLRGRRRVGKSRLVSELISRAGLPAVYFQAARGADPAAELRALMAAAAQSDLPEAWLAQSTTPSTLTDALRIVDRLLPADRPSIVVIDEAPWLLASIPGGAGELQRVWDHDLSRKPVLLLLLGSDLAMMEALDHHDAPFHGRATPMVLDVLSPRDVGRMTGTTGIDAFDAWLITGGLPTVTRAWAPGMGRQEFLATQLSDAITPLVVSGQRILDSEFPTAASPRTVLTAIGGKGERTFTSIAQSTGGRPMNSATLSEALDTLSTRRAAVADEPLSTKSDTKNRRWRVADPGLRFWLRYVGPAVDDIDRGRGDLALRRVHDDYTTWRGRAIEPVVRDALERLLPDSRWPEVRAVGGWWPRSNVPEIDLVGANARPADQYAFVGTIKWRPDSRVTTAELTKLAKDATAIPDVGSGTPLVAVCPAGAVADDRLAQVWTADDLLQAWQ
ncbi:ATP-binding protein [Cellulomonas sp. KRMCY2]|uniref:ATP-binding protein n=1 Tax=Cellulomonas sp. KRMCY2 TaxID=1304865 RepID=UPI00045EAF63|nr:ATP-binding protein [Cellulomonas sp. KRMCY2]